MQSATFSTSGANAAVQVKVQQIVRWTLYGGYHDEFMQC